VTDSAPGLFSSNTQGFAPLAAVNEDGSLNSLANPAVHGATVVFYASGEGLTNPVPTDGEVAGAGAPTPQLPIVVSIDGQKAEVIYAGGVPGVTAGLMQIVARVPATARAGFLPIVLTVGSHLSQVGGTIAVR
jgi:uncharacterized protein (TIGR03437 family)